MMGFAAFVIILVLGILTLVGGLRWLSGRKDALPGADPKRLDRIEDALASLESRLGDLHDQQRFLERLLADRSDRGSLGPGDEAPDARSDEVGGVLFETGEGEEGGGP